jgi:hypothetical protein
VVRYAAFDSLAAIRATFFYFVAQDEAAVKRFLDSDRSSAGL